MVKVRHGFRVKRRRNARCDRDPAPPCQSTGASRRPVGRALPGERTWLVVAPQHIRLPGDALIEFVGGCPLGMLVRRFGEMLLDLPRRFDAEIADSYENNQLTDDVNARSRPDSNQPPTSGG
jgi:hypothetical protein